MALKFLINQKCAFRIFVVTIVFLSSSIFLLQLTSINSQRFSQKKFAYVFYIAEPEYACYAGVNADRLLDDLSIDSTKIDILFLYTNTDWRFKRALESCSRPEVKLIKVQDVSGGITNPGVYAHNQSYVRFAAFRLTQYQRIVILDADGLVIRNLDHLFTMELDGRQIAGALVDYLPYDWLSSVLLLVEPSLQLYDSIKRCLTPEGMAKVKLYANGSHYDTDVLNYAFRSGKDAKVISSGYATLDSAYVDNNRDNMDDVYYVHFTARKPLIYVETRRKDEKMNKHAKWIFEIFWKGFAKRCAAIFESSVKMALQHVEMMERESKLDESFLAKFKS